MSQGKKKGVALNLIDNYDCDITTLDCGAYIYHYIAYNIINSRWFI